MSYLLYVLYSFPFLDWVCNGGRGEAIKLVLSHSGKPEFTDYTVIGMFGELFSMVISISPL